MAAEYFLYNTLYSNVLVDRSNTSFVPVPPYGEIFIDYFIPEIQPLYLYRETGNTIVLSDEDIIDVYLKGTASPQGDDIVIQNQFTGYTATTEQEFNAYSAATDVFIDTKHNISDFNSFTGTTLPADYYNKTEINIYTGTTDTRLDDMTTVITGNTEDIAINVSNIIYLSGQTDTKLNITDFDIYTGTTATLIGTKAPLNSPELTGTPTTPTAAIGTNTTQIATTAYYIGSAANTNPLMNNSVAIGTSTRFARQDHVHPRDITKLSLTGGTMTGTLCMTNAYMTNPSTGGTLNDYFVRWNPTTGEVRTIPAVSDANIYCYIDNRTIQDNTTDVNATYITETWNLPAGYYEYEYGAIYGNNTSNRCAIVCFLFDGVVVGSCNLMKTNDTNVRTSAYITQNNDVLAGDHTVSMLFRECGGGTASVYTGTIRIQKIGE